MIIGARDRELKRFENCFHSHYVKVFPGWGWGALGYESEAFSVGFCRKKGVESEKKNGHLLVWTFQNKGSFDVNLSKNLPFSWKFEKFSNIEILL